MMLADTNVLSELVKPRPDPAVVEWARRLTRLSVSVVTVEEVAFGLNAKPNARVQAWFEGFFQRHCEVLAITEAIARRCGWLRGQLRRAGKNPTQADMLIATTAEVHGLTLVTRNVRDFEGCPIPLLNPFSC
jgi:predicted nucleic acid-binding protein